MKKKMMIILAVGMMAFGITACGAGKTLLPAAEAESQTEEEDNRKPLTDRFFAEIAAEWDQTRR